MKMIKNLYISGYTSFEIGVFQEKDPKIIVLKNVLKKEIIQFLEQGLEWVFVSGQLGIELWAAEVVIELKREYPELKVALFFPFEGFGENWNEQNQMKLNQVKNQVDYINSVSHQSYQTPQQFKNHTTFLLEHSDASLLIYDYEYPGKTRYFLKEAQKYSSSGNYQLFLISMDDLQSFAQE